MQNNSQPIVEWFGLFLQIVNDEHMLGQLQENLKVVVKDGLVEEELISSNIPKRHSRRVHKNKKRTWREFRTDAHIAGFHIKDTMLDLSSYVNILPRKTWEVVGRPKLAFSLIQLCMENQYCILLMGHMEDVEVDIARENTYADFEVIYIMGDKYPYPTFLGIKWAFENYTIIDLKKGMMTFEVEGVRAIQPLDPY